MIKKILTRIRTSARLFVLIGISIFLILGAFYFFFQPIYKVTINGQFVGYCKNKSKLQKEINQYMETGNNDNENIAFAQIEQMPEYEICLLKKDITTNDDEIFEIIKNNSITYYEYFAILEDDDEKFYVKDFSTAENIINTLKEKNSTNIDSISINKLYSTDLKNFATSETVVADLYKEPKPVVVATTKKYTSSGSVATARNMSFQYVDIGITLARPISGSISSRFGSNSSVRSGSHTGLDIAAPKGTPIGAAASGTITFAGWKGSYGNMIVVDHGSGIQTYYAHCTSLTASVGEYVNQGETIATVGSTGNSTGPHLHLEVRINGVAYNPINYVYN